MVASLNPSRAVIAIMRYGFRGPNGRNFRFSQAHIPIAGSTAELLVGCSGGRFARH